jgi:hypothetical protein
MFIYAERIPERVSDCVRPMHGGTYKPAVAEVLIDGVPLCLHHFVTSLPAAPEMVA